MDNDLRLDYIEKLRRKMYECAKGKTLTDPRVIKISQRLDDLINKHYARLNRHE